MTADGQEFSVEPSVSSIRGDTIYAYTEVGGEALRFALAEVERVGVQRPNPGATKAIIITGVILAAVVVGAALIPSGEPYTY